MKNRISHVLALALCFSFLLGIKDGKVALWKDEDPQPMKVFPYPVSILPEEARSALEKGIRIDSEEELYSVIENYLS